MISDALLQFRGCSRVVRYLFGSLRRLAESIFSLAPICHDWLHPQEKIAGSTCSDLIRLVLPISQSISHDPWGYMARTLCFTFTNSQISNKASEQSEPGNLLYIELNPKRMKWVHGPYDLISNSLMVLVGIGLIVIDVWGGDFDSQVQVWKGMGRQCIRFGTS